MSLFSERDRGYMRRALGLARQGLGGTSPNPLVGAVVVQGNRIVGEGYHRRAGEPHAERLALEKAGTRARGGTLYVTLEPCQHTGRTPPCTEAVLAAGVRKVVYALADPNPHVLGGGGEFLRSRGLEVVSGLLAEESRQLNEVFVRWVTTGRPFIYLKAAMSLDGRIATRTGDSRWISSEPSRAWVHRLRSRVDGIVAGIGTVLADDPLLTPRLPGQRNRSPLRIIIDPHLKMPPEARLFTEPGPVLIAGGDGASEKKRAALRKKGAEVLSFPTVRNRLSLPPLLEYLGQRPVTSLLVEGGAEIYAAFLNEGLADKLYLFYAPILIGGTGAKGMVGGAGPATVAEAVKVKPGKCRRIGGDFLLEATLDI
ncbi:MAG: bifunctional diaminohydroxyphosphoribosylaminopyrimidine deaminase/5-amino-6-(5-phosphoribosylamino)uracil reductase RibD [Deltaproteobacteria bacterium]|nr:bifunctional diaminohydroxyphosphoribosylaminopyrimidine deaminase/5-amino-6-(5-phosphoribosylamino)uracil reductase RibD [Deltaproteobacteria bacterium]